MARRPPAAQTAFGPMVIAAVEQFYPEAQRLVRDELALRMLPPGLRLGARACKWGYLRRLGVEAGEKKAPGMWGGVLCRKRYADDQVAAAIAAGVRQLVILGAGLDTRAYRLAAPAGVPAFEVDLPENITYKQARLRKVFGGTPERVTLIPVDFQTDDLGAALAAAGFDLAAPAMFVWEAVTQYLTEDGFRRTMQFLADAAPGSRLIFTYVRRDFLTGENFYGAEQIHRDMTQRYDVWHFGLAPERVGPLLREYGWVEREQVGPREYAERYLEPSGRALTASEIERFVLAEKP